MLNQKLWGRGPYSLLHRKVWRTLGVMERTWGRKSIEPSWILLLLFEWWTFWGFFWDFLSCFSNMEQHNLRILPGVESVVEKRTWSIKASSLSLLSAHGACFLIAQALPACWDTNRVEPLFFWSKKGYSDIYVADHYFLSAFNFFFQCSF